MGRSLFRMLHRRFGTRISGKERVRRAREHHERVRRVIPIGVLNAAPSAGASPGSLAIVGAGFAGAAAAHLASQLGFEVTVYDAIGAPGGRVTSSTTVVPGRILETGAELIGLNHPVWLVYADILGIGMGTLTSDDDYAGTGLNSPLILNGVSYNEQAQEQLYDGMQDVFNNWIDQSAVVTEPWLPWLTPNASGLDAQNLGANIPSNTPADVVAAIGTEFELNNTIPINNQSWLANLGQFQAGGGQGFFEDTEVFHSTSGNQQLAIRLLGDITLINKAVTNIDIDTSGVTLSFQGGGSTDGPFDYVIVATSVAMWSSITVNNQVFPYPTMTNGPAIKYLAPVAKRFWIQEFLSPSGMSNTLGMTWEGTDSQADTGAFDLSVFSGGTAAQSAIDNQGTDAYFAPYITALYPGFVTPGGTFANSPGTPYIKTGYSCPSPNQVVNAMQSYVEPYQDRLFVAGEHTSPAWFGFMEGALESGVVAAMRVALSSGVDLLPEWGGTDAL